MKDLFENSREDVKKLAKQAKAEQRKQLRKEWKEKNGTPKAK